MTASAPSDWLLVRAARLFDGTGAPPVPRATVVVRAGVIHSVHADPAPRGAWPRDARVLDLGDATLLPGLIDAHVHLTCPGDGTPFETTVREPDGTQLALAYRNAEAALRAGITTLRDCGSMHDTTLDLRRAQRLGYARLPRLHVCGCPITITGGHCRYFGGEADGPEGMRGMVRRLVRAGVDFIKIMGSGGGTVGTLSSRPSYTVEELRAAVDEAHRLNRRTGIHCTCAAATRNAVAAGTDHIEHALFLTDEAGHQQFEPDVADAVARTAAVTATLCVGYYVVDALALRSGTAEDRPEDRAVVERYHRMNDAKMDNIRRMRRAGVRYIAGTDAGWRFTPFDGLAREIALLAESGASPTEAIVAATSGAAAVLGIAGETGTLRAGLAADMIAVPGDPLADLGVLRRPAMVMLGGAVVAGG
ncbi:MAG TPA: amidohydrolase family protein [bacterium]|nr:amidohydrolase family protein [bacterium]